MEDYTDSSLLKTMEMVGVGAWLLAIVAAGITLVRQAGGPWVVVAQLALSAFPTAWHVPPFGQVGLALFIGVPPV